MSPSPCQRIRGSGVDAGGFGGCGEREGEGSAKVVLPRRATVLMILVRSMVDQNAWVSMCSLRCKSGDGDEVHEYDDDLYTCFRPALPTKLV